MIFINLLKNFYNQNIIVDILQKIMLYLQGILNESH